MSTITQRHSRAFASYGIPRPIYARLNVMSREEIIRRLQDHQAELKQLGVQHLFLFGSVARGEARDDSDVDLFFDHEKGKLGLYEFMDVKEKASEILGRPADITTRDSLHPILRPRIEQAAVLVF